MGGYRRVQYKCFGAGTWFSWRQRKVKASDFDFWHRRDVLFDSTIAIACIGVFILETAGYACPAWWCLLCHYGTFCPWRMNKNIGDLKNKLAKRNAWTSKGVRNTRKLARDQRRVCSWSSHSLASRCWLLNASTQSNLETDLVHVCQSTLLNFISHAKNHRAQSRLTTP